MVSKPVYVSSIPQSLLKPILCILGMKIIPHMHGNTYMLGKGRKNICIVYYIQACVQRFHDFKIERGVSLSYFYR